MSRAIFDIWTQYQHLTQLGLLRRKHEELREISLSQFMIGVLDAGEGLKTQEDK